MRKRKQLVVLLAVCICLSTSTLLAGNKALMRFGFGTGKLKSELIRVDSTKKFDKTSDYGITPFGAMEAGNDYLTSAKPFYFSVKLPEGQYKIKLTVGGNAEGSSTTVKAESRRLMVENLKTKPGKKAEKVMLVDVRTPRITDSTNIKLERRFS